MSNQNTVEPESDAPDRLEPLPGEPGIPSIAAPNSRRWSAKALMTAIALLVAVTGVFGFSIARFASSDTDAPTEKKHRPTETAAAVSSEPKRVEIPMSPPAASAAQELTRYRIPAIEQAADAPPAIPVRRDTAHGPAARGGAAPAPEDAPVLLVTSPSPSRAQDGTAAEGGDATRETEGRPSPAARNLQNYQQQLQGLIDTLGRTATQTLAGQRPAAGSPKPASMGASTTGPNAAASPTLASSTPKQLPNRSLTLPKGTVFTCALKNKVVSATSGLLGCLVQRNVYGDDGRVLLVERGSHLDGEYRVTTVKPGTIRIPVVWTRLRTPTGVVVDLDSPGTGPLGEAGIDGHVDNRWPDRIGAALLLSLIDDSVQIAIQDQGDGRNAGDTIVLPSTTSSASKLAEKVLESTINIPPLIQRNQGGIVGIHVARDVDFSSVYELRPVPLEPAR